MLAMCTSKLLEGSFLRIALLFEGKIKHYFESLFHYALLFSFPMGIVFILVLILYLMSISFC